MGLVCAAILESPDRTLPGGSVLGDAERGGPPTAGASPPVVHPAVRLWGHSAEDVSDLAQRRTSPRLPGFILPESTDVALNDRAALRDAAVIVSAVPVQHTREAWSRVLPHVPPNARIISVAKGVENATLLRPTQIIAEVLGDDPDGPPRPIGCLSGPTIATELSRCLPATMVAASEFPGFAEQIQGMFSTSWLRVYTHHVLLGVELAGATKNVIAIAAGILD
ncbi:MAG: hypothetical protein AAF235_04265, partial [Planctomycetota bacterium]